MIKSKLGSISSIYLAYSADDNIRFRASSGGFIKSYLCYLLGERLIDYAIITKAGNAKSLLSPEAIITNNISDITSNKTNSIYAPSNIFSVFNKLDNSKRYAIVALPCQVKKLRALQQSAGKYKNITVVISLFCHHVPKIDFTYSLANNLNIDISNISHIQYRGNGWPGELSISLKDGSQKSICNYWSNDLNNGLPMCKTCNEIGKSADIIVGDPWNILSEDQEKSGKSLIVVKNETTDILIQDAVSHNYIKTEPVLSYNQLIKSQGSHIRDKISRGKSSIKKLVYSDLPNLIDLAKAHNEPTLQYIAISKIPAVKGIVKKLYGDNRIMTWYWRDNLRYINLGDYITEVICQSMGYKTINYSYAKSLNILNKYQSCLLIIGSELNKEMIDSLQVKIVYIWGQGKGHGSYFDIDAEPYKSKVKIFAVRGRHTIKQLNLDSGTPVGDPAFLMPHLFDIEKCPSSNILYVPHCGNRDDAIRRCKIIGADKYVDIMCLRRQFWDRLKEIISAKFVLTNSLHTAILCHAYNTPWALCLPENDKLNFPDKWLDFYDLIGSALPEKIATNYQEGLQWWQSTGYKLKSPDIRPLLESFQIMIKEIMP